MIKNVHFLSYKFRTLSGKYTGLREKTWNLHLFRIQFS